MKMFRLLTLLLLPCALFSQSNAVEKWAHGYLDLGYDGNDLYPAYHFGQKIYDNDHFELSFRNVSLGFFQLKENGLYHEISLTRLRFEVEDDVNMVYQTDPVVSEPSDGERTYTAGLGFQYETGIATRRWLGGFFRPGIGFGAAPELAYFRYVPKTSARFPLREWSLILGLNLVPRLHFRLSERWELVAVVPVRIGRGEWSFSKLEDPALPLELRSGNTLDFEIKPGLEWGRIGVGVKI